MFLTKEKCEELESIVLGKVAEIPRAETLEDELPRKDAGNLRQHCRESSSGV